MQRADSEGMGEITRAGAEERGLPSLRLEERMRAKSGRGEQRGGRGDSY